MRPATVGAATNAAIFLMVIIANIKNVRPAVSFRHVEPAMDLRLDHNKGEMFTMKTKHEDFKWNGILIFGKRYGRYNIIFIYMMIFIGLFGLFAFKALGVSRIAL